MSLFVFYLRDGRRLAREVFSDKNKINEIELKNRINLLAQQYAARHSRIAAVALRRIRKAKALDIEETVARVHRRSSGIGRKEEVEELWAIREEEAQVRAKAEQVEVSLVAATIQWRPMTRYRASDATEGPAGAGSGCGEEGSRG